MMKQNFKKTSSRLVVLLAVFVMLMGMLAPSAAALAISKPEGNHEAPVLPFTHLGTFGCEPTLSDPSQAVAEPGDLITIPFINYNTGSLALATDYIMSFNIVLANGETLTAQDITDLTDGTIFTWWLDWKTAPREGTIETGPGVVAQDGVRVSSGFGSILLPSSPGGVAMSDPRWDEFDIEIQLASNLPVKYDGASFVVEVEVAATQDVPDAQDMILGGIIVPLDEVTPVATLDLPYNFKPSLAPAYWIVREELQTDFLINAYADEIETHNIYIDYYNDRVSENTHIGQEAVLDIEEGEGVLAAIVAEHGANWLNAHKASERNNGVLDASSDIYPYSALVTAVMGDGDIYLKVVYTIDEFTITIKYYEEETDGTRTWIENEVITEVTRGSNILNTIVGALGSNWLDLYRDTSYLLPGYIDPATPLTASDVIEEDVTIVVVYPRDTTVLSNYSVTIIYFNNNVNTTAIDTKYILGVEAGSDLLTTIAGALGDNWLNLLRDATQYGVGSIYDIAPNVSTVNDHIMVRVVYQSNPAQTGDTMALWPLLTLMFSVMLVVGAFFIKKRAHNRANIL